MADEFPRGNPSHSPRFGGRCGASNLCESIRPATLDLSHRARWAPRGAAGGGFSVESGRPGGVHCSHRRSDRWELQFHCCVVDGGGEGVPGGHFRCSEAPGSYWGWDRPCSDSRRVRVGGCCPSLIGRPRHASVPDCHQSVGAEARVVQNRGEVIQVASLCFKAL
jgi:hypothetical protein